MTLILFFITSMSTTEKKNKNKPLLVKVAVTAEAKKEVVTVGKQDRFKISVRAPRENNQANTRVRALIAEHFGVPTSAVRIILGHHRTAKTLEVNGIRP